MRTIEMFEAIILHRRRFAGAAAAVVAAARLGVIGSASAQAGTAKPTGEHARSWGALSH
jgi:hypothetical protein